MLTNYLMQCSTCSGKGTIKDCGMMEKECMDCKNKRKILVRANKTWRWFCGNPFKRTPFILAFSFFVIVSIIFCFDRTLVSFSVLVAALGSVFIALKYKLDQANYHKDLFEERYKIFLKLDEVLLCCFHDEDKKGNQIPRSKLRSIFLYDFVNANEVCIHNQRGRIHISPPLESPIA